MTHVEPLMKSMRPETRSSKACSKKRRLCSLLAATALSVAAAAASAAPFAYVTNAFAPSVSVVDTATQQVTATVAFPAGSVPFAVAVTPDLKKVYVTSMDAGSTCGPSNAVFVIDAAANTLGASPIAVGCEPTGLAIAPDGKHAYVASQFDSTVTVIDTAADAAVATITLPRGSTLANIAISPDGQRAFVTAVGSNAVFVIDTSSNTVVGTPIVVGMSPVGIAVSPDGSRIYVTNDDLAGTVSVIDTASSTVVSTLAAGNYPAAVAFTPDGRFAYVAASSIIAVIDTASATVVTGFGNGATSIAISEDGRQAYAGSEGGNTVAVIDVASNTVTATIGGMNSPRGVAARPIAPGTPVPNVVGATQAAATAAITGAGLALGTVTLQASGTVAPGNVISQDPAAFALADSGAAVSLVVSSGIPVPDVTGKTQAAATSAITAAGLVVGKVTQQSSAMVATGSVISQSPASGTHVAGGAAVDLVVSSGAGSGGGGGGGMDVWSLLGLAALGLVMRRSASAAIRPVAVPCPGAPRRAGIEV